MATSIEAEDVVEVDRRLVSANPEGSLFNRAFLRGAAERALKTAAQTTLGALGVTMMDGALDLGAATAWDVDWWHLLGLVLFSTIASVCFSVANPEYVAGKWEAVTERKVVPRPVVPASVPTQPAPQVVIAGAPGPETTAITQVVREQLAQLVGHNRVETPSAETLATEVAAARATPPAPAPVVELSTTDGATDRLVSLQAELDAMDGTPRPL